MRKATAILLPVTIIAMALVMWGGIASAHSNSVTYQCNGVNQTLTVNTSNYPPGSTVTAYWDGNPVNGTINVPFGVSNPNPHVAHTYRVVIVSSDGEHNLDTGVVSKPACEETPQCLLPEGCGTPTTTVAPTTVAPTVPSQAAGAVAVIPAPVRARPGFTG